MSEASKPVQAFRDRSIYAPIVSAVKRRGTFVTYEAKSALFSEAFRNLMTKLGITTIMIPTGHAQTIATLKLEGVETKERLAEIIGPLNYEARLFLQDGIMYIYPRDYGLTARPMGGE